MRLQASRILGSMTAGASLVEFVTTPLLGNLSDRFGRKPFFVLIPAIGVLARIGTYLGFRTGSIAIVTLTNTIDRALTGAGGSMFFTAVNASASDVVLGSKLSQFMSMLSSYLGLAVMIGPWIGAQVIVRTGNAGNVALAAAAVYLLSVGWALVGFKETLAPEDRVKTVNWRKVSPFAFVKLFTTSAAMRKLSVVAVLQSVPNDMHDTKMVRTYAGVSFLSFLLVRCGVDLVCNNLRCAEQVTNKTVLGFDAAGIGNYMLASGLIGMGSGVVGRFSLNHCGSIGHTHLMNILSVIGFTGWSAARNFRHVCGAMLVEQLGGARSDAIKTMLTMQGIAEGMGRGEVAASIAQLSNIVKMVGAPLFAFLFSGFGQRAPFLLAAGFVVVSEALFLAVPRRDTKLQ